MNCDRKRRAGFTLLELLAVIAIIMILAGIMLAGMVGLQKRARIKRAEVEVVNLATAIRAYHTEYTRWPGNPNGGVWTNNNNVVFADMVSTSPNNPHRITFYEFSTNVNAALTDSFGSNVSFRVEISSTGNYVEVSSAGPNCVWDGDDIKVRK